MKKKVLVLDIDGTLTNSKKEITEKTKEALFDIMDMGHKVILASGRPTPGMLRYERELQLKEKGGYLLSYNGARVTDCRTGEVIYQKKLPLDMLPALYQFAKENGCGLISYEGETVISAFQPDEYVELEARINGLPIKVVDQFVEYIQFDINKCLLTAPVDVAPGLEKELQEMFQGRASIYRSEPFFIEVMPMNVDKAASLEQTLPLLGASREDSICCGDGFNDITMIRYAQVGVAMGNASDTVKAAADVITKTNDEDGLVPIIETYIK